VTVNLLFLAQFQSANKIFSRFMEMKFEMKVFAALFFKVGFVTRREMNWGVGCVHTMKLTVAKR
jgi:hypothetical protein